MNGLTTADVINHNMDESENFINVTTQDGVKAVTRDSSSRCCCSKYRHALKHAIPIRCARSSKDKLPLDTLGCINYLTFGWLTSHLWSVYRKGASAVSHLTITHAESAEINAIRMERLWREEVSKKGIEQASFASVIFKAFRTRFLVGSVVNVIGAVLTMANPMFVISSFLEYLSGKDADLYPGIYYVLALSLLVILRGVCGALCWMVHTVAATRIKSGTHAFIYKHVLELKTLGDKSLGDVVNLFSLDGQSIWDGVTNCPMLVGGVTGLIMSCVYSIYFLGPWALMAWLVIVGFYPVVGILARQSMVYRGQSTRICDQRVGLLSELLSYINFVKMNCWEELLQQKITDLRKQEQSLLEKSVFIMSVNMGLAMLVPLFASCLTFLGYVGAGNDLTAQQAFTFVSLLNTMQISLATIPFALKSLSEMIVSSGRIKKVLTMDTISKRIGNTDNMSSGNVVQFSHTDVTWVKQKSGVDDEIKGSNGKKRPKRNKKLTEDKNEEEHLSKGDAPQIFTGPVLKNINFTLQTGSLLGICGPVGAGKSSLLNAILGRVYLASGSVSVSARIAYVSQQAWMSNGTIRDNIVFGNDFDEQRYKQVLEVCALNEDLNSFPRRDLSEVGERGESLSGGQKQRISLARAAYSQCGLVLLDDALSALDVLVRQHVFTHCVLGWFKKRTVIMVTSHIQSLQHCSNILVMRDGQIVQQGSHEELFASGGDYAAIVNASQSSDDKEDKGDRLRCNDRSNNGYNTTEINKDLETESITYKKLSPLDTSKWRKSKNEMDGKDDSELSFLIEREALENAVGASVIFSYIRALGGPAVMALVMICFTIPVAGVVACNWFLSHWISGGAGSFNAVDTNLTDTSKGSILDNPDKDWYLTIYGCFLPTVLGAMILRSFVTAKVGLTASTNIHNSSLKWILSQSSSFFLSTPIGRIINRFSTDLDEMDNRLPMHTEIFLMNVLQVVAALAIVGYISVWFLPAVLPIAILFWLVVKLFHSGFHKLKCLDNITRSPVVSHLEMSVQGLASIYAYGKSKIFFKKYCSLLDANSIAVFLYNSTNRWLALRLDVLSALVILITGLLILVNYHSLNPSLAGLGIAYAIQISGLFQFTVRLAMETEARCSSVQRLLQYQPTKSVKNKADDSFSGEESFIPDSDWPKKGQVSFSDVSLSYRQGLKPALMNVTFDIKAGEKVGIVGRTGAGKSSLCSALFRLYNVEQGKITIDDVNITKLDLGMLRSRLSVVPQDPVLLAGTIRYNLDPFHQHTDDQIWQALDQCHASHLVRCLEHQLDTRVQEHGSNFSTGEKQLLCMARIFLKQSRILVLDEATSSMDSETHSLIHQTLTQSFGDRTMLVIAHRLDTVHSCSRVLVMEDGQIAEFDTPSNLLANPSSRLSAMMKATEGKSEVS